MKKKETVDGEHSGWPRKTRLDFFLVWESRKSSLERIAHFLKTEIFEIIMSNFNSISILGCGWLGFPLAKKLIEQNHEVKGSTTRKEKLHILQAAGINALVMNLDDLPNKEYQQFFDSKILFLNVPPGRRNPNVETVFPERIAAVIQMLKTSSIEEVILASSTGVYGNLNKMISEEDMPAPSTASGKAMLKVERMLQETKCCRTTILRFAGLVGGDRKAGRFFAGRKDIPGGKVPVNMVHQVDCIEVITQLIAQKKFGEIYNICADEHPVKAVFYRKQAEKYGFEIPTFKDELLDYKTISNHKIKTALQFQFQYANPLDF